MDKIPVLFAAPNTLYDNDRFDIYDINRNALNYLDNKPAIYHPPCRLFSRLSYFSTAPLCEKLLAYFSVLSVRQCGGILEHPLGSSLFKSFDFDLSGEVDVYGGFLRKVYLSWFGYQARKPTLLYFVGLSPGQLPAFPISFDAIEYVLDSSIATALKVVKRSDRSKTPLPMINYFHDVISIINSNR